MLKINVSLITIGQYLVSLSSRFLAEEEKDTKLDTIFVKSCLYS